MGDFVVVKRSGSSDNCTVLLNHGEKASPAKMKIAQ